MANEPVGRLKKLQAEAQDALDEARLTSRELHEISRFQAFLHFCALVVRSFIRNRCPVRASSLAYASLLALIPMLALVLSVSTSILKAQGEEPIRKFVDMLVEQVTPYFNAGDGAATVDSDQKTKAQAEALAAREAAVEKINQFIDRARSGAIGTTSAVLLLFVAISMLSRIEDSFNDIWGVTRGRTWYMRIVLYWAAITLGPVVLIGALGLVSAGQLRFAADSRFHFVNVMMGTPLVHGLLSMFLPVLVLSLGFAMVYQLLPNTRVRFSAAITGGLTAGVLWHANNELGVLFVSRVTSNNAIYGSLGTVPVFMVGMYFGWLILLFGAQVAYAFQNRRTYLQERQAEGVHQQCREFIGLRLATEIAAAFLRGERPRTLIQIADGANVPSRLAGSLLQRLVACKVLVEVSNGEVAFLPARPLDQITAHDILHALRAGQGIDLATRDDLTRACVREEFTRITGAERGIAAGITLQALAERTEPGRPAKPV